MTKRGGSGASEARLPRLHCDGRMEGGAHVVVDAAGAHYLRAVMRLGRGDLVRLFNQVDGEWLARIEDLGKAKGALKVERALHDSFFRDFHLKKKDIVNTTLAPTNLAYTSYLLSTAYSSPFHEVIGALLPCYWIYWEVGKALISRGSPNPLYQRWIDTYGGEEYARIVKAVLNITNKIARDLKEDQKEAMKKHFMTTSRYEWMFWDMGLRCEGWPVG